MERKVERNDYIIHMLAHRYLAAIAGCDWGFNSRLTGISDWCRCGSIWVGCGWHRETLQEEKVKAPTGAFSFLIYRIDERRNKDE